MHKKTEQRLGLVMVTTTLLVICLTSFLLLREDINRQISAIRADGANFTRILSKIPYKQLVPENSSSGVLQLVRVYLSNSALAYVAVVDTHGRLINKISAPGINPPVVKPENSKSLWLTEHQLFDAERDVDILEFRVPILVHGTWRTP